MPDDSSEVLDEVIGRIGTASGRLGGATGVLLGGAEDAGDRTASGADGLGVGVAGPGVSGPWDVLVAGGRVLDAAVSADWFPHPAIVPTVRGTTRAASRRAWCRDG
ncbi:hypothetical protein [Luteipulveratus flavus]|uniref:Uncharacterized protein n=1 Tax=Luteipulveratus flavus TaxID=3031728 RepID=A0ABT6CC58_9MICO|nr:hypothetical protein [Luteipulveratus sp. YIM 133296]MDF8265887.1 hypothetical protein [Luteipulveratus sp. YIM 133296]